MLVTVAAGLTVRALVPASGWSPGAGGEPGPPALAFWAIFIAIAEALWKGVEVAGKVALAILQYSVQVLWRVAVLIAKFAREVGQLAWKGLRQAWQLLRLTYSHVLKPAWKFVWKWVDKTERWLSRTFGPLVKRLRWLRDRVLKFYATFVRPILDIIDVSRRALRVLASLGVDWARTLDRKLAELEARIERPFRLVLAKLNEVINIVNRVVTADGLFQRLAYVRSLQRDYVYAWNTLKNAFDHPLTADDKQAIRDKHEPPKFSDVLSEVGQYLDSGDGPRASLLEELRLQMLNAAPFGQRRN